MTNIEKFWKALFILKADVQATVNGDILTEDDFNNIDWVTGVNGETAITTKTNPHSEITYAKILEEMDKL